MTELGCAHVCGGSLWAGDALLNLIHSEFDLGQESAEMGTALCISLGQGPSAGPGGPWSCLPPSSPTRLVSE